MVGLRGVLLSGLLLAVPVSGSCAVRARHNFPARIGRMDAHVEGALTVNFVPLPDSSQIMASDGVGLLNLGPVSYSGQVQNRGVEIKRHLKTFDVATQLGVLVGNEGMVGQSVTLKAWLTAPVGPYSVFLENVQLGSNPVAVDSHLQLGVLTRYELTVRVPVNTSDEQSKLQTLISMQVVRN